MCIQLYMSSDIELPIIKYDGTGQELFVEKVKLNNKTSKGLMKQFSKKHLYYIGSFQGCGCGFIYNQSVKSDVSEKGNRSVTKLFDYLKENIINAEEIELYAYSRSGSSLFEPKERRTLKISEFELGGYFSFENDEFITLRK